MYHFQISSLPEHFSDPLVRDRNVAASGHGIRYLKKFQLDAVRFLYNRLKNREFCVLNDERGLGKTATAAVLLGIIAAQKNCLVIVGNDDDRLVDWQFHLDVLTGLNVTVLKEKKDYNENVDKIYIVKWNALRLIEDLNKWRMDMVVVDNREQLLNNSFCVSILLKYFENKVQLVISGVDITSDVKLMFNVLRLGGRLELQWENFKDFSKIYNLPDQNAILNKQLDLEEYFRKREMMKDYCSDFRLRRYRYQYDNLLPLVDPQRYSAHILQWKANEGKNNATPSIISELIPTGKNTEELLSMSNSSENQMHRSDEEVQQMTNNVSMVVNGENYVNLNSSTPNDDADINMSPLIYNSDSESEEGVALLSKNSIGSVIAVYEVNDDDDVIEISDEIVPVRSKAQNTEKRQEMVKQLVEKLDHNFVGETKKQSKKAKEAISKTAQEGYSTEVNGDRTKLSNSLCKLQRTYEGINEHISSGNSTIKAQEISKTKKQIEQENFQEKDSSTESFAGSGDGSEIGCNSLNPAIVGKNQKSEYKKNTVKYARKFPMKILPGIHGRETRNMKRTTRSAGGKCFALEFEPDKKKKSKMKSKQSTLVNGTDNPNSTNEVRLDVEKTNSQTLLPPSSDSDEIYCGQRLCYECSDENSMHPTKEKSTAFRYPSTPPSLGLLPNTTLFESDNDDVILISDSNQNTEDAISLFSSSNDEQEKLLLIRKRQDKHMREKNLKNVGNVLAKDRSIEIITSPDVFRAGSDNGINQSPFTDTHCEVPIPNVSATENGPKFGLRKQKLSNLTTDQPPNKRFNAIIQSRNPSHEHILTHAATPSSTHAQSITASVDNIFEITDNATIGNTLRIITNDDISPVQHLNNSQHQNSNKITNYLTGNSNAKPNSLSDVDAQMLRTPRKSSAMIQQSTNALVSCARKSPKAFKSNQTTKLTKWFRKKLLDD